MRKPYRDNTIAWMLTAASILMFFAGCRTQSEIEADGLLDSAVSSEVGSDPDAIEVIGLSVDSEAKEIAWTLALRHFFMVGRPDKVKSGYPDVVTDRYAIEVDRLPNWKEGLGQAYAYAIDTEKMPVLALMRPVDWTDFQAANYAGELQTRYAAPLGIRVWVLVPTGEGVTTHQ